MTTLAIDDELLLPIFQSGPNDPRIAVGPVVSASGNQPDPVAVALDPQAIAVILDLVKPFRAGWDLGLNDRDAELKRAGHGEDIGRRGRFCESYFEPATDRESLTGAMTLLPSETQRPIVTDDMLARAVYLMYCIGYFNPFTALFGVAVAYVRVGQSDPVLQSHYRFQIRTFWIGLLYLAIGIPLCWVLIGIPIFAWWVLWSLIRTINGIRLVNGLRPIANPRSWLFG